MPFLFAVLVALAQAQPDNPHDVNNKDHPAPPTSQSTANAQARDRDYINPNPTTNPDLKGSGDLDAKRVEKAEKDSPHSVMNKDKATPSDIFEKLHAANLEEIDAGKLAQASGGERAAAYGKMLADDHTAADKKIHDLAMKRSIKLDDAMGMKKAHELHEKLAGLRGAEFDKAFAGAMIDGHKKVIAMAESWRASCTDKDICAMLDDTLPVLRHHEKAAEELKMPAAQGRRP